MRVVGWIIAILIAIAIALYIALVETRAGQDFLMKRFAVMAMSTTSEIAQPYDGLRVFMCGTASPLPSRDRAQACVAVLAGDDVYLVDAGARSPQTFVLERFPLNNLRAILVTHFHSDHIAAIGDFNLASWVAGRQAPLEIYGPTGVDQVVSGFSAAYALDTRYRVTHHGDELLPAELGVMVSRTISPGVVLEKNGMKITAFPVDHDPVSPAMGYRFDYKGRSVVVSGDSNVTDSLRAAAKGADLLLHDALSLPIIQTMAAAAQGRRSRMEKILYDIQDYHASAASLAAAAASLGVGRLMLYHLVPAPTNYIMDRIFTRDLPKGVILTRDRMVISMPPGSSEIIVH